MGNALKIESEPPDVKRHLEYGKPKPECYALLSLRIKCTLGKHEVRKTYRLLLLKC